MKKIIYSTFLLSLIFLIPISYGHNSSPTVVASPSVPTSELANQVVIKDDRVYNPEILSLSSLPEYEKNLTYRWDDYTTIANNKDKMPEVEKFIQSNPDLNKLTLAEKQSYARLLYKVATYYTHVMQQPDLSITYLTTAFKIFKNKEDKAWTANQLAYAYEMKFILTQQPGFQQLASYYIKQVMNMFPKTNNSIIAFNYAINGVIEEHALNFDYAEKYLQKSLAMYEKIKNKKNDQYIRVQNRLATIWLEMSKDNDALTLLKKIKKQWSTKGSTESNPFAANTLFALGKAYLKHNNLEDAQIEILRSIIILENFYGNRSEILLGPYQELSSIYKKSGYFSIAASYENKIAEINNIKKKEENFCEI